MSHETIYSASTSRPVATLRADLHKLLIDQALDTQTPRLDRATGVYAAARNSPSATARPRPKIAPCPGIGKVI